MGMPLPKTDWTAEMLQDLPADGNRYEVIDGDLLVTPTTADIHQYAARVIERWTPRSAEPEIFAQAIEWRRVSRHAPLVVDVVSYFREVFGE